MRVPYWMTSSRKKKKTPALSTIRPKTIIHQAEPEPIPLEEVLPPEGGHQVLLPDEGPQEQVPDEAEMPEGVQQPLNPDEQSEYSSPSEDTPPIKNKGKAVLRSTAWRPLPSWEEIPTNMGHGHPHLLLGLWD